MPFCCLEKCMPDMKCWPVLTSCVIIHFFWVAPFTKLFPRLLDFLSHKGSVLLWSSCTQNSHWLPTDFRHAGHTGSVPVRVTLHCRSPRPYSQPVHLPLQFPFTTNYGDRGAPFIAAGAAGEGKSRGQPPHKSQQAYWIKTQNKEAY